MMAVARPREVPTELRAAARALDAGEPVLIFDAADREAETDMVFLSERATPEMIRLLRKDAGGLFCTAISDELRARLGLPYFAELLRLAGPAYPLLPELAERPRYDRRSAFGISINHRENFTGVPDNDRALTIRTVGEIARAAASLDDAALRGRFARSFISPGHVSLIQAAPGLLAERKGHTELVISLARMAGLSESVTVCEMLGDSGGARDPAAARRYADDHGFEFLEGRTLVEAWRAWASA
ncbi:MAG TPA: 3,4-dihydroxy-2-butanone-4-phosphate synthase [Thermoplasmata archaeon]|jgi:3,4-dihydroxy 2-butanone 4-phosphate synthase|nr:3,4-dihydroxy-2-butanone-4-phosphate synthase [Thermoplasmata archaeon]